MLGRKKRDTSAFDRLRQVGVLASCSDEELGEIDSLMAEITMQAGTKLTREGEAGREFIIILDGEAEVTKAGESVATIGPGSLVGEIALLDDSMRTATVTATTPVRAFVLNLAEFHDLLQSSPGLREKIEKAAAEHRG